MHVFYKKPSSRPSTKSFLIFSHILNLKASSKFFSLANLVVVKAQIKNVAKYLSYSKQNASVRVKFESNVIFTSFWYSFTLNQLTTSMCYLSKVS